MFNPILKHRTYIIFYLIGWLIIAIAHTFVLQYYFEIDIEISIADSLVFNFIFAILGINLWYVVRFSQNNSSPYNLFINHLLAATITCLIWLTIGFYILQAIYETNIFYIDFLKISLPWRAITGILFYSVFIMLYYLIIYYEDLQEKIQNEAKLNILVQEAKLNALKSQINPHFLFNSLNSISSFTISDPEKAQDMIIKLSDFLRYSLGHDKDEKTSLKNELINLQRYIDIEKVRFGKRMNFTLKIPDNCYKTLIPNMILQPLIENTIKHGVYNSSEEVKVTLSCKNENDQLIIKLKNNYDQKVSNKKGEGIGLKNIGQRLQLIYQRSDLLKINKTENMFEVVLVVPG
jgi:two-component system, LytTR family, sensor kinase